MFRNGQEQLTSAVFGFTLLASEAHLTCVVFYVRIPLPTHDPVTGIAGCWMVSASPSAADRVGRCLVYLAGSVFNWISCSKMQTDVRRHLEGLQKKLTAVFGLPVNFIRRCDAIDYAIQTENRSREKRKR